MGATCGKDNYDDEDDEDKPEILYSPTLDILENIPMLKVKQNLGRDINQCCRGNTYRLTDENGNTLFTAYEYPLCNTCCSRWWCGPNRGFSMGIYDNNRQLIMKINRHSCRFDFCCMADCWTCAQKVRIFDGEGQKLGKTRQRCSLCHPIFTIEDVNKEIAGKLKGPCCPCRICCDLKFTVYTPNGSGASEYKTKADDDEYIEKYEEDDVDDDFEMFQSGFVSKKWIQYKDRLNLDHEHMEINFPDDMDALDRALLIGAFFLVDFMYFEMS